jgi:outer membrane immunogenic protein
MKTNSIRNNLGLATLASVLTLGLAMPAFAEQAGLPGTAPLSDNISTMSVYGDWSGFYAGAALGYAGAGGTNVFNNDEAGWDYGIQGGYLWDTGSAVLGGELQWVGTNVQDDVNDIGIDGVLRAKLIAGYNGGVWMPYVVGGWAQLTTSGSLDESDTGYLYGFGANYMLSDNVIVGGEFLKHQWDNYADTGEDVTAETFEFRVSYQF